MQFADLFSDYSAATILLLAGFSFLAGFIDSIVGGGGLIQLPALLINLPQTPLLAIFGTNKIGSLAGTSIAAVSYSRKVKFDFRLLFVISFFAFVSAYFGAKIVSHISVDALKPIILFILIAIAVFTLIKKDLGAVSTKSLSRNKKIIYGSIAACVIGFYDGFFGPGTGSFFVLAFVLILGFEFLQATAYTKIVNCATNVSALFVFIREGNYILELAILVGFFNIIGSFIGSHLAIKKGNGFIRIIFLVIVILMIGRYSFDIFLK
ncbi:MAG: TSUP family transporter [Crocinitomicaceae bacterium]|nr:TSUP family transporter [Crocinitomicaceae bacterium]MBK8925286.1 TSUP family transporter [Crocinitomicaceae bacterium]